jgi:hypothetical protein
VNGRGLILGVLIVTGVYALAAFAILGSLVGVACAGAWIAFWLIRALVPPPAPDFEVPLDQERIEYDRPRRQA